MSSKVKSRTISAIYKDLLENLQVQIIDVEESLSDLIEGHWLRASRIHILYSKMKTNKHLKELAEVYNHDIDKAFIVNIIHEILAKNNDISKSTIRTDIDAIDIITPKFTGLYNMVPITYVKMISASQLTPAKKETALKTMLKYDVDRNGLLAMLHISTKKNPYLAKISGHKSIVRNRDVQEAEELMLAAFQVWLATRDSPLGSFTFNDGEGTWEMDATNPFPRE